MTRAPAALIKATTKQRNPYQNVAFPKAPIEMQRGAEQVSNYINVASKAGPEAHQPCLFFWKGSAA